jgi:hypothetical protein
MHNNFVANLLCYWLSQAKQSLKCNIAFMGHAMNPNRKWCIVCVCLCSDISFVPWNVLTPLGPKQKSLWATKTKLKPPYFCNTSMNTKVVNSCSINNLLKIDHHGNSHPILHHVCMYGNLTPLLEILYFGINFATTCDYVPFVTFLTTIIYFWDFCDYLAIALRLLETSSFHVDDFYVYFHSRIW